MGRVLLTPPSEEPIGLAEAKAHLRVDHADEDALITGLIIAARQKAEADTHRALITQQWRVTLDAFPAGNIPLPMPKLQSVDAITYLDTEGTRQTLAGAEYQAITDELIGSVQPAYGKAWPATRIEPGSIRIDITTGYGLAPEVPQAIKAWMLLIIATWYAQREAVITGSVAELPRAFSHGSLDHYVVHYA